ncbi:MFS transporter [Nocardia sp. NPDC051990]|uniref:MFS transporter n=1 Tax=Nocardia sp. NPDC051990 TaxID=3155285 RepID=UPI0034197C46
MIQLAPVRPWPPLIWVFLGGQSVSLLGDALSLFAIPLLTLELTRSPLVSGLSAASVTIGYICVGLPAGVIVDRSDPWRVMVAMDAVRAAVFTALVVLSACGALTVWLLITLALLAGSAQVFFATAFMVAVRDMFADADLMRANTMTEAANQLALVLGPVTVGALAATVGLRGALLVDAATFVISLATLLSARRCIRGPELSRSAPWPLAMFGEFRDGLRYLLSVRVLVVLTATQMAVNFALAVENLLIFFAKDTLALTTTSVAVVMAGGGVGGVLGALCAPWAARRFGHMRVMVGGLVLAGIAIGSMCVTDSLATLLIANATYLWAVVLASLVNRTERQRIVRRDMLGRVTGTVKFMFLAVGPLGVVVMGSATTALGNDPRPVFLGAGLLAASAAVVAWFAGLRAVRI